MRRVVMIALLPVMLVVAIVGLACLVVMLFCDVTLALWLGTNPGPIVRALKKEI